MKTIIKNVYVDLGSVVKIERGLSFRNSCPDFLGFENITLNKGITLTCLLGTTVEIPFDKYSIENYIAPIFSRVVTEDDIDYIREIQNEPLRYLIIPSDDRVLSIYTKDDLKIANEKYESDFENFYDSVIELWKNSDSNITNFP